MSPAHTQHGDKVLEELGVSLERGLRETEAKERLGRYGYNELVERGAKKAWRIFAEQFTSLLVILLLVAAFVSAVVLREWIDGGVILLILGLFLNLMYMISRKSKEKGKGGGTK